MPCHHDTRHSSQLIRHKWIGSPNDYRRRVDPAAEREIFAHAVRGLPLVQYEAGPIFLGKAGKLAEQLAPRLVEWLFKAVVLALLLLALGGDPDLIAKLLH